MIQQTKTDRERFVALSRICLNNWHYISRKTLSFSEEINFFTGHSGSGKSTVIDAMQIVLYANTDGRGFFNKAAADDSDRSLIEYLRGMVNIGENNEFPHEIGIFLDYPLGDVIGFIVNQGRNFKCAGCWKVYCDECACRKTFAKYKKCRDVYVRLWQQGRSVLQLTVAA